MASICFVAGDPSGDAHAARLMEALKRRNPALTFVALGGPAMQRAGATLLDDLTKTAAIGPFDAAKHFGRLRDATRKLADHLRSQRPDLVVLVDFGDFNLPIVAPLVAKQGVPILYYISPQLWAWGRWRLRYIRRYVSRMVVFFRFEEAFYQREGIPVTWVGHPLLDAQRPAADKQEAARRLGLNPRRMTVGLLPGSRDSEVQRHLPLLLATGRAIAWEMPGVQFVLLKAPGVARERLQARLAGAGFDVGIAEGESGGVLPALDAAVVTSGTATLETALAGVPMAVVYRMSWPTYLAARAVVRIPRIAMVNVVAQRALVPEFIQHRACPRRVAKAVVDLLRDARRREAMQAGLREITEALGPPGAVERAAEVVLEMLRLQKSEVRTQRSEST